MSVNSRQIGWSQEANLLHDISKQLDRIITFLTCCTTTSTTTIAPTTTTTTTIICPDSFYRGTMTVGEQGEVYGYQSGEGGYGTINPLENDILGLTYEENSINLSVLSDCYTSASIYIDGFLYELLLLYIDEGVYSFRLSDVLSNPLPAVGENCEIIICFGDECTTTTTTEGQMGPL